MMKKRYSRFTVPNWLKVTIGISSILLISCFIYGAYLYHEIQENKTSGFAQVKKEVKQNTKLHTVNKVERFHGKNAYYVLHGSTKKGEKQIVFYPFKKDNGDIVTVKKNEIIPLIKIKQDWYGQCKNCKLINITPAMVSNKNKPAWELTYKDHENRFTLAYLSMYDASQIERLSLKQNYN